MGEQTLEKWEQPNNFLEKATEIASEELTLS